jgi:hypothetical protein
LYDLKVLLSSLADARKQVAKPEDIESSHANETKQTLKVGGEERPTESPAMNRRVVTNKKYEINSIKRIETKENHNTK